MPDPSQSLLPSLSGTALWLIPHPREPFQRIIRTASERYQTPTFLPHITLGSTTQSPAACTFDLTQSPPKAASFVVQKPVAGPDPYRRVYCDVHPNEAAREFIRSVKSRNPFLQFKTELHISLMYTATEELPRSVPSEFIPAAAAAIPDEITVEALSITEIYGTPKQWAVHVQKSFLNFG